jgi:hypothetical protein
VDDPRSAQESVDRTHLMRDLENHPPTSTIEVSGGA